MLRIVSEFQDRTVTSIRENFKYLYDESFTAQVLCNVLVALDYLHQRNIEA